MNQGIFYSDQQGFSIALQSVQTGVHVLNARTPSGSWNMANFDVSQTGVNLVIPNIFNEQGSFIFEITQPDGTPLTDGSNCDMTVEVRLRGCAPVGLGSGGSGEQTQFYELIQIPASTDTFDITVNGGVLPNNLERDLQIFQFPGGSKLIYNVMFTVSGNTVTLDPMAIMPVAMSFEVFFQIVV